MDFKYLFSKLYDVFNDDKDITYHALQMLVRSDDPMSNFSLSRPLPGQLYVPRNILKDHPQEIKDHYC